MKIKVKKEISLRDDRNPSIRIIIINCVSICVYERERYRLTNGHSDKQVSLKLLCTEISYLVKVRRESNSKGVDDVDPEGAGGCKAENLFKLEALDRKASICVED